MWIENWLCSDIIIDKTLQLIHLISYLVSLFITLPFSWLNAVVIDKKLMMDYVNDLEYYDYIIY